MKFDEIKTKEEFIKYMNQRMLNGVGTDEVSIEDCRRKCKELDISESILRMHVDIQR